MQRWVPLTDEKCRDGIARAKTMLFLTLVFAELLRAYTVRNSLRGIWRGIHHNRSLLFGFCTSLGLALVFTLVPGANDVFGLTDSLPYYGWLLAAAGAVFVAICDEAIKARIRSVTHTDAHSPSEFAAGAAGGATVALLMRPVFSCFPSEIFQ